MKNLFLFFLATFSLHAQLKEFDIRETPAPPNTPVFVNYPDDAAIIIYSSIPDLDFESNTEGIVNKMTEANKYTLIIKTERQYIKIKCRGYMENRISIPKLEPRSVRYFTVEPKLTTAARADENLFDVLFTVNEDSVYSSYGSFAPTISRGNSFSYRLPKGNYRFVFKKYGFLDRIKEVTVEQNMQDTVTMIAGQSSQITRMIVPAIVAIVSEPLGTEVVINGQKVGTTPYQGEIVPGEHQLELRKVFYYADVSTFMVEEGKTIQLSRTLEPHSAYLTVTSSTPNAVAYLNNKLLGKLPVIKRQVESIEHNLRIESEYYHPYSVIFTLTDNEEKTIDTILKPAFGSIEVTTAPDSGAEVFFDGVLQGVTPLKKDIVPSGRYLMKVSKNLFTDHEEQILIEDGKSFIRNVILGSSFSELTIEAVGSNIYVNDKLAARNRLVAKLNPGKYKIKAVRSERYYDDEQEIFLATGDKKEIKLEPKPRMGSISIFVDPVDAVGAEVYIENQLRGTAPLSLPFIIGNHSVTLKKPSYLDLTQQVEVAENQSSKITFSMKTYQGSQKEIADRWGRYKWYGLGLTAVAGAVGSYFMFAADANYDKYTSAKVSSEATSLGNTIQSQSKIRDLSFQVAGGLLVSAGIAWLIESIY